MLFLGQQMQSSNRKIMLTFSFEWNINKMIKITIKKQLSNQCFTKLLLLLFLQINFKKQYNNFENQYNFLITKFFICFYLQQKSIKKCFDVNNLEEKSMIRPFQIKKQSCMPKMKHLLNILYQFFTLLINNNQNRVKAIFKESMTMNMGLASVEIYFSISKKVSFGQAVYISGNIAELGNWEVEHSFRLEWTKDDEWIGRMQISTLKSNKMEYKYLVSDWEKAVVERAEWEIGTHNRILSFNSCDHVQESININDKFNFDLVSLYLNVKAQPNSEDTYFYVIGNIKELGSWKEKKIMKKIIKATRSSLDLGRDCLNSIKREEALSTSYKYSFSIPRSVDKFYYYYIKKKYIFQCERRPGRMFEFKNQQQAHPFREKVNNLQGIITINDEINITNLVFSKVTKQIYVGGYIKSANDCLRLKKQKISAILSIQTDKDYYSHGLSEKYMKLLCEEYGLAYRSYSIEDMDKNDFVLKAEGAIRMLSELLKSNRKVYVHCTAGIYRSPQIIAMYLALYEKYPLAKAIEIIQDKHFYARPNLAVILETMDLINQNDAFVSRYCFERL